MAYFGFIFFFFFCSIYLPTGAAGVRWNIRVLIIEANEIAAAKWCARALVIRLADEGEGDTACALCQF